MSFKRFLIWSSGGPPVQLSKTIYAILKKGIMGNIYVQFFVLFTFYSELQLYNPMYHNLSITIYLTMTQILSKMRTFGSGELKIKRVHKLSQYSVVHI